MKKYKYVLLAILMTQTQVYGVTQIFNGEHFSGIEYQHSEIKNGNIDSVEAYTLTLGKGNYSFVNYPINFEGSLKYDIKGEKHSKANNISYTSVGGRLQYNGWGNKGVILGLKGSLDNDNFYENNNDYFTRYLIEGDYPRKTGKQKDEEDLGIKFYGDVFKKLDYGFTVGFWNDVVIGKEETSDSRPLVTNDGVEIIDGDYTRIEGNSSIAVTITPKLIYENYITDNTRFVFEGYMENRKYFNQTFEVGGEQHDRYYKFIVNPQLSTNKKIGENAVFTNYMAFENEKFEYLSYWQHILKITPNIEYKTDKFTIGAGGGGYDYEDEIGIVFDNKELFAYKKSDSYSSFIISPKIYGEYNIFSDFYLGQELNYRYGKWESDNQNQYLSETSYVTYLKYEKEIVKDIDFLVKTSYEIYRNNTDIPKQNRLPEEDAIRVTVGVKAYF